MAKLFDLLIHLNNRILIETQCAKLHIVVFVAIIGVFAEDIRFMDWFDCINCGVICLVLLLSLGVAIFVRGEVY